MYSVCGSLLAPPPLSRLVLDFITTLFSKIIETDDKLYKLACNFLQ